jgi:hypothetical protein
MAALRIVENARWEKMLSSPQKLEETLSKRLDSDKLVFSQKLQLSSQFQFGHSH